MLSKFTKAIEIINYLGLERLPNNGGWFKLIHHDVTRQCSDCEQFCQHANSTTIFYLFEKDTEKRWYRIDATMIWSFLAGDPLQFSTYCSEQIAKTETLGNDFTAGQQPLILMPRMDWRMVSCAGQWSLASCICTPGFEIEQLEIAAEGWAPGDAMPALKKYAMQEPLPETNLTAEVTDPLFCNPYEQETAPLPLNKPEGMHFDENELFWETSGNSHLCMGQLRSSW